MFATAQEHGTSAGPPAHPLEPPFLATVDVYLPAELRLLGNGGRECGRIGPRERSRGRPPGARPVVPGPGRAGRRGRAAVRQRRGPDARLDGPGGVAPPPVLRTGHVLLAKPAQLLRPGRDL